MNIQADETTVRENCAKCEGIRNCEVICKYNESGSDDHFDWHCDWYLLKCKGCDYVFIKKTSGNSEDTQDFEDEKGNHQS